MDILNSPHRIGNFTSSNIHKLLTKNKSGDGFGVPALTYIRERNMERMLGRSLSNEINSRETSWGNLLEAIVFEILGTEYTYTSQKTMTHPTIPYWRGSADGIKEVQERAVFDIKCTFTLSSFLGLVLPLYIGCSGFEAMKMIRNGFEYNGMKYPAHADADKYYFQLVSNAIINGCDYAELIVFCPYKSELQEIYLLAQDKPEMKWLSYASDNEVPSLPDGGRFKNINIISFKIPQEDKDMLTECVLKAGEFLITNINNK